MKVDHVLILAAGAGTRMGEIGKQLPKVLWPVFEKSILELEVAYARKLGAKNIYINIHHYKDKMLDFISSSRAFDGVNILVEEEKIDIGGAVHNMAGKEGYAGNLLLINSDQFIWVEEATWKKAWEKFSVTDTLLFGYEVNSSDLYNALDVREGSLRGIVKNKDIPRNKKILTYTGMALVKLDSLRPVQGPSGFFETVANPNTNAVACQSIEGSPYWDFGTLARYWRSVFEVLDRIETGQEDRFVRFLVDEGAVDLNKIGKGCYGGEGKNLINLSEKDVNGASEKIILSLSDNSQIPSNETPAFVFNELLEKL